MSSFLLIYAPAGGACSSSALADAAKPASPWISEGIIIFVAFPSATFCMTVKVGDKIITSQYAGSKVTLEDVEYLIVRQSDILAIVE